MDVIIWSKISNNIMFFQSHGQNNIHIDILKYVIVARTNSTQANIFEWKVI